MIKARERGERSKSVTLFTYEFGLIYTSVQSARSIGSKLRFGIEDFSLSNFTLLRGRNDWKVVGAENIKNYFYTPSLGMRATIMARALRLMPILLGEEKNIVVYELLREFLGVLSQCEEQRVEIEERHFLLKILKNLGYVKEGEEEISTLSKDREKAISVINRGLRAAEAS